MACEVKSIIILPFKGGLWIPGLDNITVQSKVFLIVYIFYHINVNNM